MEIVQLESQPALSVSASVGTLQMPGLMGRTFVALSKTVSGETCDDAEQKTVESDIIAGKEMPVGFPYCIYKQIEWEKVTKTNPFSIIHMMLFKKWHIEMGVVANKDASGEGMEKTTFPGGRYLQAIHTGPYGSVGKTYAKMWGHIQENDLKCDSFSIERYLNDPRNVSSKEIKTELLVPLI